MKVKLFNNAQALTLNANDMTREESKELIEIAKDSINKLVELGADYKHFQSAQYSHKNLKKIQKLISPIH